MEKKGEQEGPIKFYGKNNEWGEFSNFYPSPIQISGKTFPTVEHYFQSRKFVGLKEEDEVIQTKSPGNAFMVAKKNKHLWPKNWQEIKEGIMYEGLKNKFTVHPDLKEKLLSTGNRELIEHTEKDTYWADGGGPGKGLNRLGVLLMQLREELRKSQGIK